MTDPWRTLAVALVFAGAVWLVFLPAAGYEFVNIDDQTYVVDNPHVRRGLTVDGVIWAFTTTHASNWHPLTWLSHMLDGSLYGLDPAGHHRTSVWLHALNAGLLLCALRLLGAGLGSSTAVAALFAVHPLRVESVAWVAERKDLLAGSFWMLTLIAWAWYARRPGARRYLLVLLPFTLGLLSKAMLVTLPLVLLLLDHWPLGRTAQLPPRRLLLEKVPLVGLALLASIATALAQRGATVSLASYGLVERLANALTAYLFYMWKTIAPRALAVFYPLPAEIAWGPVFVSAIVLTAVTVLALRSRGDRPWLTVGWLWFLVTLLPVIGLLRVGVQAQADRYTYLPGIGLAIVVVWGVAAATGGRRFPRRAAAALGVIVVALLAVGTRWQLAHWHDSRSLFTHALEVTERNHLAHLNLGVALADAGRLDEAEVQYREAKRLDSRNPLIPYNVGNLHRLRGDGTAAEAAYREAAALGPTHAPTRLNLGLALLARGRTGEALEAFEAALLLRPGWADAEINRGNTLRLLGRPGEATACYRRALEREPDSTPARLGLAGALLATGEPAGTVDGTALLEALLAEQPELIPARLLRATQHARQGQRDQARAAYREVLRLDPDNTRARAWLEADSLED